MGGIDLRCLQSDYVKISIQLSDDLQQIILGISAAALWVCADGAFDDKLRSAQFPYTAGDCLGVSASVFQVSAELVGAVIYERREHAPEAACSVGHMHEQPVETAVHLKAVYFLGEVLNKCLKFISRCGHLVIAGLAAVAVCPVGGFAGADILAGEHIPQVVFEERVYFGTVKMNGVGELGEIVLGMAVGHIP